MSDKTDDQPKPRYSTLEFLRLVFLNPLSGFGLAIVALGVIVISLSAPGRDLVDAPVLGGGLLLTGTVVFALGYTRAQVELKSRERGGTREDE